MSDRQAALVREMHALRAKRYSEEIHADLCKASLAALLRAKESYLGMAKDKLAFLQRFFGDTPTGVRPDLATLEATLALIEADALALRNAQAAQIAAQAALIERPLAQQCALMGIQLECIHLNHSPDGWIADGVAYKEPEAAAFAYFQALGYAGTNAEGKGPLALMKCACLDLLCKHIPLGRGDACTRYFEAQCEIMWEQADEIVACIRAASDEVVERNIIRFLNAIAGPGTYPEMTKEGLLALWHGIGRNRLADFAKILVQDPYGFRAGWPDLTLVKGGQVRFVEIKTTERLHTSQRNTICELLLSNGANVSVLKISAARRIGAESASLTRFPPPPSMRHAPALSRPMLAPSQGLRPRPAEYS